MSDATEALLHRIRAAKRRKLPMPDGRRTLHWRLPEWEEQFRLGMGGMEAMRAAVGLVEDWAGFQEADLAPAGAEGFSTGPVAYSRGALNAALAADPALLGQLLDAVLAESQRRKAAQDAASGN